MEKATVFLELCHITYDVPDYHLSIRAAGSQYLVDNSERFIESNTNRSWIGYLNNISRHGTWCDALIIQGVAESTNAKIHIVESHHDFTEQTIIRPLNYLGGAKTIFIEHIQEFHFVSTVQTSGQLNLTRNCQSHLNNTKTVGNTAYLCIPVEKNSKTGNVPS